MRAVNDCLPHQAQVAAGTPAPPFPLPREFASYLSEPLAQHPAGGAGKQGVCALSFVANQGGTRLHRSFVTHPFHLTPPWRLDSALPGMAVVYVQTPAGGLIQGDRARLEFTLARQAQAHITTQAAEKIHTMTANCALQQVSFKLSAHAYAEYCPEPVIVFPGARFAQEIKVTLEPGACCFLSEIFLSRRAADGVAFAALASTVRVQDAEGKPLLHERSVVFPQQHNLHGPGILGEAHAWGAAFLVGSAIPQEWAREVHERIAAEPEVHCGATALHEGRGVSVKAVGQEARVIRRVLHLAWDVLRRRQLGAPAPIFPK